MDPLFLIAVFLLLGMILIFAELFIPSGGLIGVASGACFIASLYIAYQQWFAESPLYFWAYLTTVAVIIPVNIVAAFQVLLRTSLGNKILLKAPTEEEVLPYQQQQEHLKRLIGQRGRALNLMTPGGLVLVGGERLHAIAEGLMIEANTEVELVDVRGTRVIVRPVANSLADNSENSSAANPVSDDTMHA